MSSERDDVNGAQFGVNGSNVQAIADLTSHPIWSRLIRSFFLVQCRARISERSTEVYSYESPMNAKRWLHESP
jgi:hypothetical protein